LSLFLSHIRDRKEENKQVVTDQAEEKVSRVDSGPRSNDDELEQVQGIEEQVAPVARP